MSRGPIFQDNYRPQFSGHETFPLRYGWLKKTYDAIKETEGRKENKSVFLSDDAIARFGVGKNMVASMRHWSTATGVLHEQPGSSVIRSTPLGNLLFGHKGLDPYMEHPATLWLLHWSLAARPHKTTWFWAFNHYSDISFSREDLIKGLSRLVNERGWTRVSPTTIKNDVACFIRTYVSQRASEESVNDDAFESPFTELGLIKGTGKRDGFRFVRGSKATLGDGVFSYALFDFWASYASTATLSFESIVHEPGSPGRVFLLDEDSVVDHLINLEEVTRGKLRWSETAGLKQVVRSPNYSFENLLNCITLDYTGSARKELN